MFSGTGHHIHGGNFYNVAGDISLQTHHHLTVQNHESHTVAFGLTSGREDDRVGGSYQQVMIQEDDQPPAGSTLGLDTPAAGSDSHGWAGVASNPARSMAVRPAPYGTQEIFVATTYVLTRFRHAFSSSWSKNLLRRGVSRFIVIKIECFEIVVWRSAKICPHTSAQLPRARGIDISSLLKPSAPDDQLTEPISCPIFPLRWPNSL
jgi:hypothetical protein